MSDIIVYINNESGLINESSDLFIRYMKRLKLYLQNDSTDKEELETLNDDEKENQYILALSQLKKDASLLSLIEYLELPTLNEKRLYIHNLFTNVRFDLHMFKDNLVKLILKDDVNFELLKMLTNYMLNQETVTISIELTDIIARYCIQYGFEFKAFKHIFMPMIVDRQDRGWVDQSSIIEFQVNSSIEYLRKRDQLTIGNINNIPYYFQRRI